MEASITEKAQSMLLFSFFIVIVDVVAVNGVAVCISLRFCCYVGCYCCCCCYHCKPNHNYCIFTLYVSTTETVFNIVVVDYLNFATTIFCCWCCSSRIFCCNCKCCFCRCICCCYCFALSVDKQHESYL